MELRARAGGKLLLFGEHAVLYKFPALGLGLPRGLEIFLDAGEPELTLDIPEKFRDAVFKALGRIASALALPLPRGRLTIKSDIPLASGFGSSAALCVALARLCGAAAGRVPSAVSPKNIEENEAWKGAHEGEKLFHGTPSGIDTALAALGGLLRFDPNDQFPPSIIPIFRTNSISLVYGAVPRRADCAGNIAAIAGAMARGDNTTRMAIEALGDISHKACTLLQNARVPPIMDLALLATRAMSELRHLKLSTPELDKVLATGLSNGALGGKLSGGGGGGAYWLVCPDIASAVQASAEINKGAARLGIPPEMHAMPLIL